MKKDHSIFISFVLLVLMASLYRILPNRPFGFAPQIAMALFAGSIVQDKKYSFLLPIFSMLVSDIIYEMLYHYHISSIPGFYSGQLVNYILFAGLTVVGFAVNQAKPVQILTGAIAGTTLYFMLSNFAVWIGGGWDIANQPYPKTITGLLHCYSEAIPFYKNSLYATVIFSALLFGGYFLINKYFIQKPVLANV